MDSYINEPDVAELLPNGQIPVYKNLQLKNIKAGFEGSPKNFKSSFSTDLPEGSIAAKADLDFTSAKMKYNVDLETTGLNVEPVAKISTFLNSKASIIGEGVKPNEMAAQIHFSLSNSKIQQYLLDSLNISSTADNGKIIMRMLALSNNAVSSINANLDIRDKNNPVYNAAGNISNLNIRNFIADTSMRSNFNFGFTLKGRSFDFHNMESAFTLNLAKSQFKGINIDPTNLELIYTRPVLGQRLLQFNSDFADLIIRGNYSIDDAAAIIGYESKIISQSIIQKVYEFNPLAIFNDSLKAKDFEAQLQLDKIKFPKIINQNMEVNYSLIIKDLKLVSMLAGVNKIDMDGKIGGVISNDKEAFRNTNNITLKYLKIFAPGNMIYVSDLNFDLDVNRRNTEISFGNIGLNLNLTTGRVFSGTDLKNISLRFGLQNNLLKYSLAAEMDTTIKAQIAGIGDIADNMFKFAIDTLAVDYKKIKFVNDSSLIFAYSKEAFDIKHFSLSRNGSRINLGGSILGIGMLKDLTLKVDNLDAGLIKDITGIKSNIGAKINLLITSNGYFDKPEIKLGLNVDNITAGKVKLGNLQGNLDYANKLLKTDILILDSTLNKTNPALSLTSKIPIDLGIIGVKKRLLDNQPVSIQLKSNNFDLSTFGNLLPYVGNLNGKLIADMNIGGTTSQYIYSGKLDLNDVSFLSRVNNLPYGLDMHIRLDNESISLDNFSLKNTGGTQFGGTLNGSGMLNLKGFDLQNAEVTLSGDLAVLSPASKSTLPAYGDLALQTDGDWRLTYKAGNSSFNGSVLIKNTNLTIVPTQSSYSEGKDAFIFHYVIDSTKIDKKQSEFADVIALSRQYSPLNKPAVKKEKTSFNYNLHVKIQNEAKVIVVVNKELNQQLTVLLGGELFYGSSGVAQGKFSLLEGSNLSFFKTFTAEGSIYFESDITNPRLDIIATYIGNHDVPVAEQNSAGT
ncbi:MAG: translocation/assembly module TamB domain-containing protein, partial [Methanococcaceae archaeon]